MLHGSVSIQLKFGGFFFALPTFALTEKGRLSGASLSEQMFD